MTGKMKERTRQDASAHLDEHPCLEWFRWFVRNCLRTQGSASNREVLLAMRAILDAALEASSQEGRKARKPRPRSRKAR
jgi:hypothetical protein